MYFNSYLFIFLFLPAVIAGYYILARVVSRWSAQIFLLGMSMLFYGYAGVKYLMLLVAGVVVNYIFYLFTQQEIKKKGTGSLWNKIILVCLIVGNLSVLLLYKYYDFTVENINNLLGTDFNFRHLILPLGISFITFQQIAFAVDSYRGETGKIGFLEYAIFVFFFPHIASGPIITHDQFIPVLRKSGFRKIDWEKFGQGMYLFGMGMGKKVLIADMLGVAVNWGYSHISDLNMVSALFVTIFYSMQVYFDFSGYSDMAIGISRMMDMDLPINFDSPYKADSLPEFWKRWHISLTHFLTKYLYIPLGGSRKGRLRMWLNTEVIFLCSGFWHGANWTFAIWGILHGTFMIFAKETKSVFQRIPKVFRQILTLGFVNLAWIFFRSDSLKTAGEMFRVLFCGGSGGIRKEICEPFQVRFLKQLFPAIPESFYMFMVFGILGIFLLYGRNVQERAATLKYKALDGIFWVIVMVLSILSFADVATFLYFSF